MWSGVLVSVKGAGLGSSFSHAFSRELKSVGVVHEAVEDSVGEHRVADDVVPALDGDLAGDDRGCAPMAIFDDLEQIAALGGAEDGQAPVVENEQLDASERLQEPTVTAVAAGERERFEQAQHAVVQDGAVVAAGLMTEGARDPTFTRARGATDQQVLMAVDPAAGDETREDSPVEATRRAQIDVLDAGVLARREANLRRATRRLVSRSAASRS